MNLGSLVVSVLGGFIFAGCANIPINTSPLISRNISYVGGKEYAPDAQVFIVNSEDESKKAIQIINQFRKKNKQPPINYSSNVYKIATARAKDMTEYKYYDFTNPQTNLCTEKIKANYGFKPEEYLAESLNNYVAIGVNVRSEAKTLSQVTQEWIDEYEKTNTTDQNFLFDKHVAGAVGCDGSKCVFLGLNAEGFGRECVTNKKSAGKK